MTALELPEINGIALIKLVDQEAVTMNQIELLIILREIFNKLVLVNLIIVNFKILEKVVTLLMVERLLASPKIIL